MNHNPTTTPFSTETRDSPPSTTTQTTTTTSTTTKSTNNNKYTAKAKERMDPIGTVNRIIERLCIPWTAVRGGTTKMKSSRAFPCFSTTSSDTTLSSLFFPPSYLVSLHSSSFISGFTAQTHTDGIHRRRDKKDRLNPRPPPSPKTKKKSRAQSIPTPYSIGGKRRSISIRAQNTFFTFLFTPLVCVHILNFESTEGESFTLVVTMQRTRWAMPFFHHAGPIPASGRRGLLLPLLFVVTVALLCAPTPLHGRAWSAVIFDDVYGPCGWSAFAPDCPACGATVETKTQYSPIQFTQADDTTGTKMASLCLTRQSPYVERVYTSNPSDPAADKISWTKPSPSFLMDLNPAGSLRARCTKDAPLFVRVHYCGTSGGVEGMMPDQVMEVVKVQYFAGVMHTFESIPNMVSSGDYYEAEYHLVAAEKIADSDTNLVNDAKYRSVCQSTIVQRKAADLIISVIMTGSTKQVTVNDSIVVDVLKELSGAERMLQSNSGTSYTVNAETPLLPLMATTIKDNSMWFYFYEGSVAEPPCTPKVKRIVLKGVITLPMTLINLISSVASAYWNQLNALQRKRLDATTIYQGKLYQFRTGLDSDVPQESSTPEASGKVMEKYTMDDRVLGLAITCILLFGVLLILLFSRYALVEFLPVGFGGLNYRMEWFRRSYEKAEELKALKDHDDFLAAEHQRQLREASGEVPPSSHRRHHRHAADSSTSSDASSFGRKEELSSHSPSTQQLIGSAAPATEDPVHLYSPTGPGTTGGGGLVTFQNTAQLYDHSGEKRMGAKAAQPSAAPAAAMDDGVDFQSLMSGVDKSRCLQATAPIASRPCRLITFAHFVYAWDMQYIYIYILYGILYLY
eukprot:gene9788-6865_t